MFTKSRPAKIKAGEADGMAEGQFEAIVSVFGNKDVYGDVVLPGAFTDTLTEWKERGDPIPVYWSHRMDDPDFNIGHVLEAKETDKGLWVAGQLDTEQTKAAQVYRLLKGRRVTQFSFAYDIDDASEESDDTHGDYQALKRLTLHEVGPTPIGANPETELLTVKGLQALAARVAMGAKAGRVLSAKNEQSLRAAYAAIGVVLSALDSDDGKATVSPAKIEERSEGAKIEEPTGHAARFRLSAELALMEALAG